MFVVDNPTHPFAPTGFLLGSSVGAFFSTPPRSHINPLSIFLKKTINHGNGDFDAGSIAVAL